MTAQAATSSSRVFYHVGACLLPIALCLASATGCSLNLDLTDVTGVVTKDGVPLSGLVVREEGKIIVIVDNTGKEQRVASDDIEPNTRKIAPISPMPANVRDAVSEEDFYHLLGYLLDQQPKK